ncbi:hypothetical protein [uncultured Pseudodesulfovibrio sp.]|uniref:hypothetical protein n=1 Tax=uncultured Pseudodesulfovibrio sp. TaxID=2035858 RepID=UPI0029C87EE0|nr:hypothetical protein [uncultured Pseudodesulfovibrio sp.]
MRKMVILAGLAVLLALFGCNGATVAEDGGSNDGFPEVTLPDGMTRLENSTIKDKAVHTGPVCFLLPPNASIRTQGEVYVAASGKVPEAICWLLRERLIVSRGHWKLLDGKQVLVNGKYYHEGFYIVRFDKDQEVAKSLRDVLTEHGYETPKGGYVFYSVTRNVSSKLRFQVIYGFDLATIPKDVFKSSESIEKYFRKRFADDLRIS